MLAFIDESGDEGTGGSGSRWLVFGCVMVSDANVGVVRRIAKTACMMAGRGKMRWLHFKDLSHDDRRGVISILNSAPWSGVVVASDTTTTQLVQNTYLGRPTYHYNYAARYVIERVSAMAKMLNEPATIYFEERRNFDLANFRAYVQKLLDIGEPRLGQGWLSPARIHTMPKRVDESLCIADGLANAAYKALEPHRIWGHCETAYLEAFKPMLWRGPSGQGNIYEWGFVLMPTSLWGVFAGEYPWVTNLAK